MGLKVRFLARIWASRLGFGPQGQDLGLEAGGGDGRMEKEKKEKFLQKR